MKKIIGITIIALVGFSSCSKKKDIGGTAMENMANEWWAELKLDGENVYGPGVFGKIATYNTAANTSNEIWVDDVDALYDFKVKATADPNALTFSATQAVSIIDGYEIWVTITDGKILPGAGHSKTGNVTDSIYMKVEFEDDPGTIYTIEGHARTRFAEDDY